VGPGSLMAVLGTLDMSLKLSKAEEAERLEAAQERLLELRLWMGGLTLEYTDHQHAPWHVIEADSKRYARVKVIETVIEEVERGMAARGLELPS
jgi:hypothetical protein